MACWPPKKEKLAIPIRLMAPARLKTHSRPQWSERVQDKGRERCAIVTVSTEGHQPLDLLRALRKEGIHTSRAGREAAVLDFDDKGVDQVLRISPHYYNTEEEIVAFVDALSRLMN